MPPYSFNDPGVQLQGGGLGSQLPPDQVQKYIQLAQSHQFPWEQLGYSSSYGSKIDPMVIAYLQNFGRLPTPTEADVAGPQFQGPNGNAWVAALAQQQQAQPQLQQALTQQGGIQSDLINKLIGGLGGLQTQGVEKLQNLYQGLIPQEQQLMKQNLGTLEQTLQDQYKGAGDYFSPTGQGGQALMGAYNNQGLLNSGAFNSALAQNLGTAESNAINQATQQYMLPALQGIQGIPGQEAQAVSGFLGPSLMGQQSALGQGTDIQSKLGMQGLGYQTLPGEQALQLPSQLQQQGFDWQQFNAKQQLAQQLAEMQQPSGFQTGIGEASSIMQGLGGLGQGAGLAATATSYICYAMIERGLATKSDLDLLHYKTIPAVWWKARAFWYYAIRGRQLVEAANKGGIDWKDWRKEFLDQTIGFIEPIDAVNHYAQMFKALCMKYAPHLWDERVMRTSFRDSLPFLPRLLFYKPYLKALFKVLRMRSMFLIDLPLSRISE